MSSDRKLDDRNLHKRQFLAYAACTVGFGLASVGKLLVVIDRGSLHVWDSLALFWIFFALHFARKSRVERALMKQARVAEVQR